MLAAEEEKTKELVAKESDPEAKRALEASRERDLSRLAQLLEHEQQSAAESLHASLEAQMQTEVDGLRARQKLELETAEANVK